MADLNIVKGVAEKAAARPAGAENAHAAVKPQPSKFDEVRSQLAGKAAADLRVPPPAQISGPQTARLESALRKKLTGTRTTTAAEFFGVERKNTELKLQNLTQAVNGLPKDGAFGPVRQRLNSIETQFQQTGQLINGMKDMDPQTLLRVQIQMYQMSENVEILSKLVDQMSSGVKTIFQTQV